MRLCENMKTIRYLVSVSTALDYIARIVCGSLLISMLVVTNVAVLFRFVLNTPISWVEEFLIFSLVWTAMLGISVAWKVRAHIALVYFRERLPKLANQISEALVKLCICLFLVFLTIEGTKLATFVAERQTSPNLGVSMGWAYFAIPVGSLIMLIHLGAGFVETRAARDKVK